MSLIPLAAGGAGFAISAEVSLVDSDGQDPGSTTYTFTSKSLGAAVSDRIIVCGTYNATLITSSVTIGGVSATLIVDMGEGDYQSDLWYAAVPTGTTGTVVITTAGATSRMGMSLWRVVNSTSTPHASAISTANPGTNTINVPANGILIGCAAQYSASSTWTWSGGLAGGEDFDTLIDGALSNSGASAAFSSTQTGLSVTATPTGSPSDTGFCLASFGPTP